MGSKKKEIEQIVTVESVRKSHEMKKAKYQIDASLTNMRRFLK